MKHSIFLFVLSLVAVGLCAQKLRPELRAGYYAPYFVHTGGLVGCSIDLKKWTANPERNPKAEHSLTFSFQLGYYVQWNVSHNLLPNPQLGYKWKKRDKPFYWSPSVGAAYLFALRRKEGLLDLATGKMHYENEALHYFVPNIGLELGMSPVKTVGFFFQVALGRKLGFKGADAGFLSLSAGLVFKLGSCRRKTNN